MRQMLFSGGIQRIRAFPEQWHHGWMHREREGELMWDSVDEACYCVLIGIPHARWRLGSALDEH